MRRSLIRSLLILATVLTLAGCSSGSTGDDSAGGDDVVLVQGTTSVRDSGLLDNVLKPGFEKSNPGYTLKFIAVGTGEALANAENGQADAVFVHDPDAEAEFVADGYAEGDEGAYVMLSDFITVGASADPAMVRSDAGDDAVGAFEAIASAGERGQADFVSRGDDSGTNKRELSIWALTDVPLNSLGEPGSEGTSDLAPWYHKAGIGMASTLSVTEQCPFPSKTCYTLTDRGTFNYLVSGDVINSLRPVSEGNEGPGGKDLLLNPYHAYVIDPVKVPTADADAGRAFVEYVTSPEFQAAVAKYPSAKQPAFIPKAT